jgi:hypothetical protein
MAMAYGDKTGNEDGTAGSDQRGKSAHHNRRACLTSDAGYHQVEQSANDDPNRNRKASGDKSGLDCRGAFRETHDTHDSSSVDLLLFCDVQPREVPLRTFK